MLFVIFILDEKPRPLASQFASVIFELCLKIRWFPFNPPQINLSLQNKKTAEKAVFLCFSTGVVCVDHDIYSDFQTKNKRAQLMMKKYPKEVLMDRPKKQKKKFTCNCQGSCDMYCLNKFT